MIGQLEEGGLMVTTISISQERVSSKDSVL